MRAICPGSRSGKHLGHTRERVAVSFTSAVSGEPVEPAAWDPGDQDATRVLEKGAGMGAKPSAAKPGPAAHPIALPGLMRASGETCAVAPRSPEGVLLAANRASAGLFGRLALRGRSVQIRDSMPELALGTRRTERQKPPATVRPPCPLLRDRKPLVRLEAALGAAHDAEGVGMGPVRGIGWISHGSALIILSVGRGEAAFARVGERRVSVRSSGKPAGPCAELDQAHPGLRRGR